MKCKIIISRKPVRPSGQQIWTQGRTNGRRHLNMNIKEMGGIRIDLRNAHTHTHTHTHLHKLKIYMMYYIKVKH